MGSALPAFILDAPFTFRSRPAALEPDLRPLRRVALLLLLVDACRGATANLEQLHVLDWAIRTEESRRTLIEFLTHQRSPDTAIVRFDPTLDRAVSLASGCGLLMVTSLASTNIASTVLPDFRIELTLHGRKALSDLDAEVFETERAFIEALPRKLTQSDVRELFTWGIR